MTSSHASTPIGIYHDHTPARLANYLIDDVRNAVLVSQSEISLKEFSSLVVTRIQSVDAAAVVEEYSGHEFLSLISRLNQEVALFLQKQAHALTEQSPRHIWTIHQADQLSDEQQSIIFKLTALFPALPFRVIWLSNRPLHAWESHAGTESVLWDLDTIDLPLHKDDRRTQSLPKKPTDSPQGTPATPAQWPHATGEKKLQITVALLVTAILGALAWLWVVPSNSVESDKKAPTSSINKPNPVVPLTSRITSTERADKAPPEIALTGAQWLKSLPSDSYVVEHGWFETLEQVQNFQSKHKDLSTARIIAARKTSDSEDWQFTVVTGHFRTEDRAKRYVSRLDWRANARIRGTEKLKTLVVSGP
jgi:hypothetical protein